MFFDFNDGKADHVGIVTGIEGDVLKTIEGNRSPRVEEYTYPNYKSVSYILGYGILPENKEADEQQIDLNGGV